MAIDRNGNTVSTGDVYLIAGVVRRIDGDTLLLVLGEDGNVAIRIDAAHAVTADDALAGGGGGGAPIDAQFIVSSANGTLTAERVLTDTTDIVWDFGTGGQAKANFADAKLSLASGGLITGLAETSTAPSTSLSLINLSVMQGYVAGELATAGATILGIVSSSYQPLDAQLSALAVLTPAADRLPYFTGLSTMTLATFTAFGRSLVDDADAATARTTLGASTIGATVFTAWDRIAAAQALGVPVLIYQAQNTAQAGGSTAETDVVNTAIAGGIMGAAGGFDCVARGYLRNASGLAVQYTLKVYLGGTVIYQEVASMASTATATRPFILSVHVRNTNDDQFSSVVGRIITGDGATITPGEGNFGATAPDVVFSPDNGALVEVDTSTDQDFRISLTMNSSNVNAEWHAQQVELLLIPSLS